MPAVIVARVDVAPVLLVPTIVQPPMSCAVAETLRSWMNSSLAPEGPWNWNWEMTTVVDGAASALGASSANAASAADTATGRRKFT